MKKLLALLFSILVAAVPLSAGAGATQTRARWRRSGWLGCWAAPR